MTTASELRQVHAALADPTRGELLDALAQRGTATATELGAELPVTRQAVAKHLAVLARAGLVTASRQHREVRYQLQPERLSQAAQRLAELAKSWDTRLTALKRLAESQDDGL